MGDFDSAKQQDVIYDLGAGLGGDNPAQTSTWPIEDEDVWGTRETDLAPPVLGGTL